MGGKDSAKNCAEKSAGEKGREKGKGRSKRSRIMIATEARKQEARRRTIDDNMADGFLAMLC
jgi:hypothetical protein